MTRVTGVRPCGIPREDCVDVIDWRKEEGECGRVLVWQCWWSWPRWYVSCSSCCLGGMWCGSSSCRSLSSCGSWWVTRVHRRQKPSPLNQRVNAARPRRPTIDPRWLAKGSPLLTALHKDPNIRFLILGSRRLYQASISHCALREIRSVIMVTLVLLGSSLISHWVWIWHGMNSKHL